MKKVQILIGAVIIALASACNFTEEITLQEDGSGKLSINFDGSELMEMAGEEMKKTNEKAVDSIISFKDLLEEKKDSIATLPPEEQAKLKKLEPFKVHMVMNPDEKMMRFNLFSDFKNVSEVNDAFNAFQGVNVLGSQQKGAAPAPMGNSASEVSYSFVGNNFTRKSEILDQELFQKQIDSMQGAEMFLSGSTYTLKYHFPKKVRSTTAEEATFSADGKTLIYEVKFLDLMKDPSLLDLEVELED